MSYRIDQRTYKLWYCSILFFILKLCRYVLNFHVELIWLLQIARTIPKYHLQGTKKKRKKRMN